MHISVALSTVLGLSSTVYASCYFPNGQIVHSDTACNPNALESACCFDHQACLSNGLCASDPHDPAKTRFHRGSCTDPGWKSSNCPRQCLDINNNGVPVYSCNASNVDSYCCYDDCECESPFQVFTLVQSPADVYTLTIIAESFTQTHISTTAPASSTNSPSSRTTLPSTDTSLPASDLATPDAGEGYMRATILGLAFGLGIPGVAALLVGAFFLWRHKKRSTPETGTTGNPSEIGPGEHFPAHAKYARHTNSELQGDTPVYELSASPERHELPAMSTAELPATNTPEYNANGYWEERKRSFSFDWSGTR